MNKVLRIVGKTSEGQFALAGVFLFFSTYGLPIDIIAIELKERGFVIAWDEFYKEASESKVGFRSIMLRMQEVCGNTSSDHLEKIKQLWSKDD